MPKVAVIGRTLPVELINETNDITFYDSTHDDNIKRYISEYTSFDEIYVVDDLTLFIKAPLNTGNAKLYVVFYSGDVHIGYHGVSLDYLGGALLNNFLSIITSILVKSQSNKFDIMNVYKSYIDASKIQTFSEKDEKNSKNIQV